MSDGYTYVKNKIADNVKPETEQWITNEYIPMLERKALSRSTQKNYLQGLKKLLLIEKIDPLELEEMSQDQVNQLGKTVAANIQSSKYQERGGETHPRRKNLFWKTFQQTVDLAGHDTDQLPEFKAKNKGNVKTQADTKPEEMPTPEDMKQFIQTVGKHTGSQHQLRNQALLLLLWDKGPRIGEALNIKLKDCEISNDRLTIKITGNKKSEDRKVEIYQGRETLKEFIQTHPGKPDDYLFSDLNHEEYGSPVSRTKFGDKHNQVNQKESFDFKTFGEPNHIFRKAMVTSHVLNDWATWEEVCKLQGKSPDSTKPDYLKMALSDVNNTVGQKIGALENQEERDYHMLGEPLLPQKCQACQRINKCFVETCQYCSGDLSTPDRSSFQTTHEEQYKTEIIGRIKGLKDLMEKSDEELEDLIK